jgi:hypothetical protein
MRKHVLMSGSLLGGLLLALATPALPQKAQVVTIGIGYFPTIVNTIDVPGAGTGALQGTVAIGIDAAGDVAGTYIDSLGVYHGFVYTTSGTTNTFYSFDALTPGKNAITGEGTIVTGISSTGDISGYSISGYSTGPSSRSESRLGFMRATDGTITTFQGPDNTGIGAVLGINSVGTVTGLGGWIDGGDGFVRAVDGTGANFNPLLVHDAPNTGIAIDTAGAIAGRYHDNSNVSHGFVLSADGTTITTFDPPNVATTSTTNGNSGTTPTSIDTAGDIAGTYTDTSGARHSFVRTASGTITPFDPPGANTNPCASTGMGKLLCGSGAFGMDDAMDIVGTYFDMSNVANGFLRYGSTGSFVAVSASAAGTGAFQGTAILAINASGTMAGTYADSNSMLHGFTYSLPIVATTTMLTPLPTPNPSIVGEPITMSATVTSSNGTPPNGETVNFNFDGTSWGSAPLGNGAASNTVSSYEAGTFAVTASYPGDSKYLASTSVPVNQVVNQASTTTTLVSWQNPSTLGQSVTLVATVAGQFGGLATGSVAFSNGSTSLGSATLGANNQVGSNQALLTTTALPVGTNSITAVYSGDTNFTGSTSAVLSQVVDAGPDFTVAIAPATISVQAGQSGTTTITVQDVGGFNGNVSFACSGLPSGAKCSFTQVTVPTPAGVSYSTLTVTTSGSTASLHRNSSPLLPSSALAVALCCFGWKKRRRLQMLLLVAMSIAGLSLLNGCGGGGATIYAPPVTVSTITVTATSGPLSHATTFTLTVN